MQILPASVREVKSIIEVVNLKTQTRFQYLKGNGDPWKFPFKKIPDGFKDLLFTPDGLPLDGEDPDEEFAMTDPPCVPPDDPLYAGDPTLSFERPVRPGEFAGLSFEVWRLMATAAANQREGYREETPGLEIRRDNVVKMPASRGVAAPAYSAGRKLKLAFLPGELYESPSFGKLKPGAREQYRIYRTYCKLASGTSLNSYIRIGEAVTAELLMRRKKDMLGSSNPVTRKEAKNIGVSVWSIRRNSLSLQKAGWIVKIIRGRPKEDDPYVNKFLVVKSEKQRLARILEGKKKVIH